MTDLDVEYGDILSVEEGIIVHGCNAQGMMGAGLALQIREKYPGCYERYKIEHERFDMLHLGSVVWYKVNDKLFIANAITQRKYGFDQSKRYVDYDAIRDCFHEVADAAVESGLRAHFPMIGCGLGGGDWREICPIIRHALKDLPQTLWINPPALSGAD